MPFVYKNSIIKQDPFIAYKRELELQRRNPNKELSPSPSLPKDLVKAIRQKKAQQQSKPKPFRRVSPKAKNEDFRFFTIKSDAEDSAEKRAGDSLERSPLRNHFSSKAELEQSKNKERLEQYNMYWHLQEFDPIDLDEEMEIDEKYKKKLKHEKICEKFRSLGEQVHIRKFMNYEKTNAITHLYNKNRKIENMMKQMNITFANMQDEDGNQLMSYSKDGEKLQTYGPKILLQREVMRHNSDSLNLVNLMERSRFTDDSLMMNENSQMIMEDSMYITP